jgi:hypothetical protein
MNSIPSYKNVANFKTFKGIYVDSCNTYYLCDFYYLEAVNTYGIYHVHIEFHDKVKQEFNLRFTCVNDIWTCDHLEGLAKELIKDLIEVIKVLEQKRIK